MAKPREAPRLLSAMAKKKSEPAERIRQLMESLQGGGGKNNAPKTVAGRQQSSTPSKVDDQAVESPASVTEDSRQETERPKEGINRAHYLSNDGLLAIDDEPDEEKVCRCLRVGWFWVLSRSSIVFCVLFFRGHVVHTKFFKTGLYNNQLLFLCASRNDSSPDRFDVVHPVATGRPFGQSLREPPPLSAGT